MACKDEVTLRFSFIKFYENLQNIVWCQYLFKYKGKTPNTKSAPPSIFFFIGWYIVNIVRGLNFKPHPKTPTWKVWFPVQQCLAVGLQMKIPLWGFWPLGFMCFWLTVDQVSGKKAFSFHPFPWCWPPQHDLLCFTTCHPTWTSLLTTSLEAIESN